MRALQRSADAVLALSLARKF
uniref:Uncharacterized protein n=1 Tax=Arundo donax TaxID=35708 RepID=A0A0A9ASQ9_ARUDO